MRIARSVVFSLLVLGGVGAGAPAIAAEPPSCIRTVGAERAALYVRHCIQVSPATRPPCHADNPCTLIVDEIVRGCALFRDGAGGSAEEPAFCPLYLPDPPAPAD